MAFARKPVCFYRDGPIEVALKPSFVLTGICLYGWFQQYFTTHWSPVTVLLKLCARRRFRQPRRASTKTRKPLQTMWWLGGISTLELSRQLSPELNRDYNQTSPNEKRGDSATDYLPMIIQGGKRYFADEEKQKALKRSWVGHHRKK